MGAFGASFGPTILLSLFWRRFNYKGAVAGVVSGFVVDLGWLLTGLTASTGILRSYLASSPASSSQS